MARRDRLAVAALAVVVAVAVLGDDEGPSTTAASDGRARAADQADGASGETASAPAVRPAPAAPSPSPTRAGARPSAAAAAPARPADGPAAAAAGTGGALLLAAATGGDGDSWRDTSGREYRLGLVNAPETGECFGREATAERRRLVAGGFRAQVYAQDRYDRAVAVITTADGRDVNVELARRGFVDDRYLAQFRSENPPLATRLDAAFAAARAEGAGLWTACSGRQGPSPQPVAPAPAPAQPRAGDCHPDYTTCIPVKGDGSGRGGANDLDCGDLDQRVQLRQRGVDPYRLDADGDGVGCNGS